ncbi:hypothetical protein [Paracoccus marinaquae]|uniref:Meckel syndrome type 1 protein n=1 Tax=Paracoccus marinaquae TaxID=2841926 RepID=A0ABS6AFY7_9RHOB|nr:hypothetical protein [Paracoccus marinaquae]MBU3029520.1 hypothetical protein [Paracoccus marinaquae]
MNQHIAAPEFAMSFTQEAVLLERRDGTGWRLLGQVRFAGREMAASLKALRAEAGDGSDSADTVLVIPDDQVLYTTLSVPFGSDTPAVIGRALEAITPCRAEDLAFDWCPADSGDIETLRVAAVARRTLDEAEDFARAQGFRPSGFLARPGDARFEGYPDFGPSRLATEDAARRPFGATDLSKARITAPVIDEAEPAKTAEATPEAPPAPVVSRIIAHHVAPPVPVAPTPAPAAAETADNSAPVQPLQDLPAAAGDNAAATPDDASSEFPAPAVIRHGERKAADNAPRLSPRAAAVHERAAEARAVRASQSAPETLTASGLVTRLRGIRPGRLPAMIGVLVIGLVAVLMLFGGGSAPQPKPVEREMVEVAQPAGPANGIVAADVPEVAAEAPAETLAETPADAPATMTAPAEATPETAVEAAADPAPLDGQAPAVTDPNTAADGPAPDEMAATPGTGAPPEAQADPEAAVDSASAEAVAPADAETPSAEATPTDALTLALTEALAGTAASDRVVADSAGAAAPAPASPATSEAAAQAQGQSASRVASTGQLRSSLRPPNAPVRTTAPAAPDRSPVVPANPLPYSQPDQARAPAMAGTRPPGRPAAARSPAAPVAQPAATPVPAAAPAAQPAQPARSDDAQPLGSSGRPPARPDRHTQLEEGSAPEDGAPVRLTAAERAFLEDLLRDLRTAQAGQAGLDRAEREVLIRLADARPVRKPVAVSQASDNAVRAAVAEAVAASERPSPREPAAAVAAPAGNRDGLGRSARPPTRPGSVLARGGKDPGPGNPSLSSGAVEDAIAAAVANSTALPGAVALTALRTSALPPRRIGGAAAAVAAAATPSAPSADDLRAAAEAQQREAEQRRIDDELQAQAEARARAQAAADAQAEARERAQAEARARAQAEAEARTAAARKQTYTPPEAENEPEVAAKIPEGRGQGSAATAATVADGITLNRTQIIGTVGAGKASRALVRLSNGRIITLRLGDRINGGTITGIGNSRITYVKGGRPQELSVLNGQ